MENRKPEPGGARVVHRPRVSRMGLLVCAVLVILVFLILAARVFVPGVTGTSYDTDDRTFGQTASPAQAAPGDAEPQQAPERTAAGALIIDDPGAGTVGNPLARISPAPAEEPVAPGTAAEGIAATDARRASSAPPAAPARRTAAPRARAAASPRADDAGSGNDLLTTLMRIIKQEDASASAHHASMDALVAHISSQNEQAHSQTSATLASLGQARPEQVPPEPAGQAAPSRAQQELRACPPANTLQGINCRDRVCARHAGRDPACPAR